MKVCLRISQLLFLSLILFACAASDSESRGKLFCNINQTETYQLGVDPAVDFNVTNLQMNTRFNNVTCPDVNNESFEVFISRVKRVGNTMTIIQNQFNSSQIQLDFEISGDSLSPIENALTINNCTIKRTWSGTIDTPGTTITLLENIDYRGNCATVFLDPERD